MTFKEYYEALTKFYNENEDLHQNEVAFFEASDSFVYGMVDDDCICQIGLTNGTKLVVVN